MASPGQHFSSSSVVSWEFRKQISFIAARISYSSINPVPLNSGSGLKRLNLKEDLQCA
jgi:hypothetical protein